MQSLPLGVASMIGSDNRTDATVIAIACYLDPVEDRSRWACDGAPDHTARAPTSKIDALDGSQVCPGNAVSAMRPMTYGRVLEPRGTSVQPWMTVFTSQWSIEATL